MNSDERFERLDVLGDELAKVADVHVRDVGALGEELVATVDVAGVNVVAIRDEDGGLLIFSDDEGFEDPDDLLDHINTAASDDALNAVLDELDWLRSQHGHSAVGEYSERLRQGDQ